MQYNKLSQAQTYNDFFFKSLLEMIRIFGKLVQSRKFIR